MIIIDHMYLMLDDLEMIEVNRIFLQQENSILDHYDFWQGNIKHLQMKYEVMVYY